MFQLVQSNNAKLENILKKQDSLEIKFNAQDDKINEILSKFDGVSKESEKGKGKEKKSRNEFYQVNIYFLIVYFVYSVFT